MLVWILYLSTLEVAHQKNKMFDYGVTWFLRCTRLRTTLRYFFPFNIKKLSLWGLHSLVLIIHVLNGRARLLPSHAGSDPRVCNYRCLLEEELAMENGIVIDEGSPCKEPRHSSRHYELDAEEAQEVRSTSVIWFGQLSI